jgi:hypothetical protein
MTLLRNAFAIILGFVTGSVVNMTLITAGPKVIPVPPGVDMSDPDKLAATIHLLEPRHFLFPFLAHALGTLTGSFLAHQIAGSHQALFARIVGALFLAGGVAASQMIPAPTWFLVLDLAVAYLPMAWLGVWLGRKLQRNPPATTPAP